MLRGGLPLAALSLAPRDLDKIPAFSDQTTSIGAARAALRAQVEDDNASKKVQMETLIRDHSNRVASLLAKAMRAKAGLRLRKLQL
eukprot:6005595-Pleurochrysis_carterae.AAC.1